MYQKQLLHEAKAKIVFPEKMPLFNSLETLAQQAYELYKQKNTASSYLMPKYLQSPAVKK